MPEHFTRPENALKKAHEFLDVQKQKAAQEVLLDVIKSKRHRNWSKVHEEIMVMLIKLNVELRDNKSAKESLFQYKLTCHSVNIKSLEDMVRRYLSSAETRVEGAKNESKEKAKERLVADGGLTLGDDGVNHTLDAIEDLEVIATPEDLLLGSVTGDGTRERTDNAILVPWVKFLWEAYRNCLELLRNNKLVEKLYQEIAKNAMGFCIRYDRKNEFRRLCDSLRTHLNQVNRNTKGQNAISLTNPESQALHLDTRITQLDNAIKIELWQEAFKAVEDIHFLMNLKKAPDPRKIADFYSKLGVVFLKANMNLFHSCTQHKLFKLNRDLRKNLSQQEHQLLASRMLMATLAIPITEVKHGLGKMLDIESSLLEKHQKMARLLDLERSPSRASLMQDLISRFGALRIVPKPLSQLYQYLEVEENPLQMNKLVESVLSWINEHENSQMRDLNNLYAEKIRHVMASRILIQVSSIYKTITFPRLTKLLPNMNRTQVERMIVDASRIGQLRVRIDHSRDLIKFGLESDPSPLYVDDEMATDTFQSIRSSGNEWVSNHLNALCRVLEKALHQMKDDEEAVKALRNKNHRSFISSRIKDEKKLKLRREATEIRIEEIERENAERENRERKKIENQERDLMIEEEKRREAEREAQDKKRKEEQARAEKLRQAEEKLNSMKKTDMGSKLFADMTPERLLSCDMDQLFQERVQQLKKNKKEDQEKLKNQERKMDHYERAKRRVEIPKLAEYVENMTIKEQTNWDILEAERLSRMKEDWENALATKNRLSIMKTDAEAFQNQLKETRRDDYLAKKKIFDEEVARERKKLLEERRQQRIQDRREVWMEQVITERKLIEEEKEQKRLEEERLAKEKEEMEKEKERKRKMEEEERIRIEAENKYRPPTRTEDRGPDRYRRPDHSPGRGPPRRPLSPGGYGRPERRRSPPGREAWGPGRDRGGSPGRRPAWGPPRDDHGPPRRPDPGPWRRGSPPRGEGGMRRESPPRRRFSPPPRDGPPGGAWRRGASPSGPIGAPRGGLSPPRGPPRRDLSPRNRSPPRRDLSPSRRGPPRDRSPRAWGARGGPRDDPRGPPRDDPRGPPRDDFRGPPRDDPRGPPRGPPMDDRGPYRGPSRDDRGPRDDFRGPPRDDFRGPRDDFRGPPRDDFRRGPPRDDFRGPPRDDRGPPRDDRGPRDDGPWRRPGGPRDAPRDHPASEQKSADREQSPKRPPVRKEKAPEEDADGWSTAVGRRR